jgi:hypothetical protein
MKAPTKPPRAANAVPLESIEILARGLGVVGEAARRITVLGARRHIGSTLAAITLARSLDKQGRVVLVDLALGSPILRPLPSTRPRPAYPNSPTDRRRSGRSSRATVYPAFT